MAVLEVEKISDIANSDRDPRENFEGEPPTPSRYLSYLTAAAALATSIYAYNKVSRATREAKESIANPEKTNIIEMELGPDEYAMIISDLHANGTKPERWLRKGLSEGLKNGFPLKNEVIVPKMIVGLGDMTNKEHTSKLDPEWLKVFVSALKWKKSEPNTRKLIYIPGNHDFHTKQEIELLNEQTKNNLIIGEEMFLNFGDTGERAFLFHGDKANLAAHQRAKVMLGIEPPLPYRFIKFCMEYTDVLGRMLPDRLSSYFFGMHQSITSIIENDEIRKRINSILVVAGHIHEQMLITHNKNSIVYANTGFCNHLENYKLNFILVNGKGNLHFMTMTPEGLQNTKHIDTPSVNIFELLQKHNPIES